MKPLAIAAALVLAGIPAIAQEKITLKDQKDKVSYSIGLNIGSTLKQQGLELNTDALSAGLKAALSGEKALLTEEQVRETLMAFQREMMTKELQKGEENKKVGEEFLAKNKSEKGVVSLPSGLQYKVIREGKGEKPKATDVVKTHYRGTLIDGTEFDSSTEGEPVEFPLNRVIPGWTEALQLMPVGSKWQLFVPAELAYGQQGQGPIPPNSTLIFEVELLGIQNPEGEKK